MIQLQIIDKVQQIMFVHVWQDITNQELPYVHLVILHAEHVIFYQTIVLHATQIELYQIIFVIVILAHMKFH